MDLFLLLLPAVLLPVGLGITGLWWLHASGSEGRQTEYRQAKSTPNDDGQS
jgi:hypothetical protein